MALGFFEAVNPQEQLLNPNALDRRRKMAEVLGKDASSAAPVQHWTQALARVLQGAASGYENTRLDKSEKANSAESAKLVSALLGGSPSAPSAPAMTPDPNAPGAASTPVPGPAASSGAPEDIKSGIAATAQALGVNPVDLATAISYETGGTFDPTKGGPTTKWGQHRGLIQFGEPQAQKYGVDWNNPVGSQLGPEGAVAKYLRDTGVKPGMGLLDIYSAINAGGVGRYGASDAAAGGAPGTVADKVNQQMAGHRAKALAMFGEQAGQTALNAYAPQDGLSAINQAAPMPPPRPPELGGSAGLPQQLAGAATPTPAGASPVAAGGPQMQAAPQGGGDKRAALVALLTSPYVDASTKSAVMTMARDQFGPGKTIDLGDRYAILNAQNQITGYIPKSRDATDEALKREQLNAARIANEKAKDPTTFGSVSEDEFGNKRYGFINPVTKNITPYVPPPDQPAVPAPGPQSLPMGAQPAVPGAPQTPAPVAIERPPPGADPKEWRKEKTRMAANPDKLTEGQAKALQFANRMENSERTLGALEKMGTNKVDRAASSLPVIGNMVVSEDFQKYKQAEREFINSVLRRESGAVISDSEYANFSKQYFPQPGDSAEVIAQKRQSRKVALEAMKKEVPNYKSPEMPKPPPPASGTIDLGGGFTAVPVN